MTSFRGPAAVAALTAACTAAVSLVATSPASAATAASCTKTSHKIVFGLTRSVVSWKVPATVHKIGLRVAGASGANSFEFADGGPGGSVTARVAVAPGQVLKLVVGASGGNPKNGNKPVYGGGNYNGGGGSFVFSGGKALVVAGGGGAGGFTYAKDLPYGYKYFPYAGGAGGSGNNSGGDGDGTGATTTAPGSNRNDDTGLATGTGPATGPKVLGIGGTAPGENSGGGGYYGGGGGTSGGGDIGGVNGSGGGGSGYLAPGVVQTATATNTGDGKITITWSACPVS